MKHRIKIAMPKMIRCYASHKLKRHEIYQLPMMLIQGITTIKDLQGRAIPYPWISIQGTITYPWILIQGKAISTIYPKISIQATSISIIYPKDFNPKFIK